jgi:hypothetical protein
MRVKGERREEKGILSMMDDNDNGYRITGEEDHLMHMC